MAYPITSKLAVVAESMNQAVRHQNAVLDRRNDILEADNIRLQQENYDLHVRYARATSRVIEVEAELRYQMDITERAMERLYQFEIAHLFSDETLAPPSPQGRLVRRRLDYDTDDSDATVIDLTSE